MTFVSNLPPLPPDTNAVQRNKRKRILIMKTPLMRVTHPITQEMYHFRIATYRRGGVFTIQTSAQSQAHPKDWRDVRPSKQGYYEVAKACAALIAASKWDPRDNPGSEMRRVEWNDRAATYPQQKLNESIVGEALPYLFDPKKGRRTSKVTAQAQALVAAQGGMGAAHVTSRSKRIAEVLTHAHDMQKIIDQMDDQSGDARKCRGLTQAERRIYEKATNDLKALVSELKRQMYAASMGEQPAEPEPMDTVSIQPEPVPFDDWLA